MPVAPIQTSFLGGELAPSFHGRVDLDIYRQGARELFNLAPQPSGALLKRRGTRQIALAADNPDAALNGSELGRTVVLPGRNGKHGHVAVIRTDGSVQCWGIDGMLECLAAGRTPRATSPEMFSGALPTVEYDVSVDWNGQTAESRNSYSVGARYPAISNPVSICLHYAGYTHTSFTPEEVGTHTLRFSVEGEDAPAGSILMVRVGATDGYDDLGRGDFAVGSLILEKAIAVGAAGFTAKVDARNFEIDFTVPPADENQDLFASGITVSWAFVMSEAICETYGSDPLAGSVCLGVCSMHSPTGVQNLPAETVPSFLYTAEIGGVQAIRAAAVNRLNAMRFVWIDSERFMLALHPEVAPFIFGLSAGTFTVNLSTAWFDVANLGWSSDNFPSFGTVWQGRLWLSGCPERPDRFWASQSGNLLSFSGINPPSATPAADDAMSFDVGHGNLRWMLGAQSMAFGASDGEAVLEASQGVVSRLDFQYTRQSAFGGANVSPALLGDRICFVGADRRSLRTMEFSQEQGRWWTSPISAPAEHLFRDDPIAEIVFLRFPDPTLVARLDSGSVVACSYNPGAGVAAWWRLYGVTAKSLAVSDGADGSRLWILREHSPGVTTLDMLALGPIRAGDFDVYLDSYFRWSRPPASAFVPYPGLERLNGQTVTVWVDDVEFPAGASVADATLYLGDSARAASHLGSEIRIGNPVLAWIKTLPLETPAGRPGTGQGSRRRWPKLCLRLGSGSVYLPTVNGDTVTLMDTMADSGDTGASEDYEAAVASWGRGGVQIAHAKPTRFELLAIFGVTQANEV